MFLNPRWFRHGPTWLGPGPLPIAPARHPPGVPGAFDEADPAKPAGGIASAAPAFQIAQVMPIVAAELLIVCLLVLANGVLSAAETAIVSARKLRLERLAEAGDEGAKGALLLAEHPARFLALVQFWLTLSGMIVGVLAGAVIADQAAAEVAHWPALAPWARAAAFIAVTVGLTCFMLVFGELVPKRIALADPEKVASSLAPSMRALAWLAGPILGVLGGATEAFARICGIKPRSAEDSVGGEEVRALVEKGLHAGVFQPAEKAMVEGVLSLDNLRITAIMTPRPKIVFLNLDDPEETNWRKIVTSGHSYFPVYQGNRDQVVGLVSVKALWAHSAIGLPTDLKNLLVPPLIVPESMTAIQLLEQCKKTGRHTGVVVDEFGVVQGLVTLIDVFEAIVGDLPEPGERNRPGAKTREDGSWLVDATLPVADLKALLQVDVKLPNEGEAEFQTAGGFIITQLGRIPLPGDAFEWAGWRFEVSDMDRRRVDKLIVSRAPASAAAAESGPGKAADSPIGGTKAADSATPPSGHPVATDEATVPAAPSALDITTGPADAANAALSSSAAPPPPAPQ
jgi:putative hemolysin